jgi:hypothetical protein
MGDLAEGIRERSEARTVEYRETEGEGEIGAPRPLAAKHYITNWHPIPFIVHYFQPECY